jgi:hypothetical protein
MNADIDEFLDQVDQWESKVQEQLKPQSGAPHFGRGWTSAHAPWAPHY